MAGQVAALIAEAAAHMQAGRVPEAEQILHSAGGHSGPILLEATTGLLRESVCPATVHFSIDILKKAAVRDWHTFSAEVQGNLFVFTRSCIAERSDVLRQCRALDQVLHLYAVLAKLAWRVDVGAQLAHEVTSAARQHLQTPGRVLLGAAMTRVLIEEFNQTRAGVLGKPWQEHEDLRRSFGDHALLPLADCLLKGSASVFSNLHRLTPEEVEASVRLLADGVLGWEFGRRDPDTESPESLRPGATWHDTLLQPSTVHTLLQLHAKVGRDLQHHIQEAVLLLCGVEGKIFRSTDERINWVEFMLDALFELSKRAIDGYTEDCGDLLHGCCRGFYRVTMCTSSHHWYMMPTFADKTRQLATLTCAIAREHGNRPNDAWMVEALERLLNVWATYIVAMLDEVQFYSSGYTGTREQKELLQESCKMIFEAFLEGQMQSPPVECDDDHHDSEFSGSAQSFAALLGRLVPTESLPLLVRHVSTLAGLLQQPHALPDNFHDGLLVVVNVTAELLADPPDSEVPGVPNVLMEAARRCEGEPNPEDTCGVLLLAKLLAQLCDGMLGLVASHPHSVSPLTLSAILHGLARWTSTYICPDPDANIDLSPVILGAFDGGKGAVEIFVTLAHKALATLSSDPDVTAAALKLLMAAASKQEVQEWLPSSVAWRNLAESEATLQSPLALLTLADRCKLMEVLCLGSGKEAFLHLLPSIETNVKECLSRTRSTQDDGQSVRELVFALTRVRGVGCSSVHAHRRQAAVFEWMKGLFGILVQLAEFYKGRQTVVSVLFELLDDLVKAQNAFIDEGQMFTLLECCTRILQIYCQNTKGVVVKARAAANTDNDDTESTLICVMLLLQHVVEWDMLHPSGEEGRRADAGELVFIGVHHLISLINKPFLENMALANELFSLLDNCFTLYCDKLQMVPPDLTQQLMEALQYVVRSAQPNLLCAGYRSIAALANYCIMAQQGGGSPPAVQPYLQPFLSHILQSCVAERMPPSSLPPMSRAMLCLMVLLGPDVASGCFAEIVQAHPQRSRLEEAFARCLSVVPPRGTVVPRKATEDFRKVFETFSLVCRAMRM